MTTPHKGPRLRVIPSFVRGVVIRRTRAHTRLRRARARLKIFGRRAEGEGRFFLRRVFKENGACWAAVASRPRLSNEVGLVPNPGIERIGLKKLRSIRANRF